MINSKLVGKSLPEIIHMIVFEQLTEVNYYDGSIWNICCKIMSHKMMWTVKMTTLDA